MESIMNKSDAQRVLVRLPEDVKAFLDREAERNFASRNSEIIRSIRVRMETEQRERATG
jgi:hypothetical protein